MPKTKFTFFKNVTKQAMILLVCTTVSRALLRYVEPAVNLL